MGDPVLAETMRRFWKKPPVEKIVATDFLATSLNRATLGTDLCKRIVDLECGHKAVTRSAIILSYRRLRSLASQIAPPASHTA